MKQNPIFAFVFTIFIIGVGICGGLLGYWGADRELPIDTLKLSVLTPVVPAGGFLQIKVDIIRKRRCGIHVDRYTRDSIGHRDFPEDIDTKDGVGDIGPDSIISTIKIPDYYVPGAGSYTTLAQYVCNPLHYLFPIKQGARQVTFKIEE